MNVMSAALPVRVKTYLLPDVYSVGRRACSVYTRGWGLDEACLELQMLLWAITLIELHFSPPSLSRFFSSLFFLGEEFARFKTTAARPRSLYVTSCPGLTTAYRLPLLFVPCR